MKRPSLTPNQRLAALAFVLGAIAIFSQPHRGPFVKLDARALAMVVDREVDHVTPTELASWIIEGRSDFRLLDLRAEQDYAAYHIPTAENVPVAALPDYPLQRTEKVVLYSEGGIHAAQAWMLMKAQGYTGVYTVLGGLDGWKDEVLYPVLAADAAPQDRARFERTATVAKFFGGQARLGLEAAAPSSGAAPPARAAEPELPKLTPPVSSAPAVTVAPRKKKKEGC